MGSKWGVKRMRIVDIGAIASYRQSSSPALDSTLSGSALDSDYLSVGNISVASNTNRFLIVFILATVSESSSGNPSVSSVTYGGFYNLTQINDFQQSSSEISIWGLVAPDTGSQAVEVSMADFANVYAEAYCYYRVNQTTPTGTVVSNTDTSTAVSSTVTSTTSGNPVLDGFIAEVPSGTTPSATVGTGQTQVLNTTLGSIPYRMRLGSSRETASGSSTAMTWTLSASKLWLSSGVEIKP